MTDDIERYRSNLHDELNGAALYAALAAAESDPLRKDLFLQLAQAESAHAQLWRDLQRQGLHCHDSRPARRRLPQHSLRAIDGGALVCRVAALPSLVAVRSNYWTARRAL
jgi:hypothetical protein